MRKSLEPTPFILVRASSISDSDPCDFALVNFSIDDLEEIRAYVACAKFAQEIATNNFSSVNYYYSVLGYYKVSEYLPSKRLDEILGEEAFGFVVTSDEELSGLETVEALVDEERLEVYPNGDFFHLATGDGTETLFKTSIINLSQLDAYFNRQ